MDPKEESEATATEVDTINQEFAYRRTGFHEPTSPIRVSATRRFFFGGSGGALSGSSLSTGGVAVASPVLALGSDSGRTSLSATTLFAGVSDRFTGIRGERDGGRDMVDSAGVVDGVCTDEDVRGTAWL
jgi:hypothetical protein